MQDVEVRRDLRSPHLVPRQPTDAETRVWSAAERLLEATPLLWIESRLPSAHRQSGTPGERIVGIQDVVIGVDLVRGGRALRQSSRAISCPLDLIQQSSYLFDRQRLPQRLCDWPRSSLPGRRGFAFVDLAVHLAGICPDNCPGTRAALRPRVQKRLILLG
jgi:hypothetical protein